MIPAKQSNPDLGEQKPYVGGQVGKIAAGDSCSVWLVDEGY